MDPQAVRAWSAARPRAGGGTAEPACIAPWVTLEFDPQGWVYACCANQLYPLGRIGVDRLRDLWAGDRSRVLREALERWDLSVGCGSCRWHLEHGQMEPDAAVYDRYRLDGPDPAGPVAMTFALSNRCNLACAMCNGELSSTIRHRDGLPPLPARYGDEFFDDLAPFLPGLQYAKFLGGEPFLIPEHDRVWRLMDEVGGPERMQVTTNGTVWTDRVEWLLSRFRLDLTVSIDAFTPERYESIRAGASHATLLQNVARFHQHCRAAGTELRFCFCLMSENWMELAAFLRWADGLEVPVSINVVSDVGLALHDRPLAELEAVAAAWDREQPVTGLNAGVWETQRTQLAMVVEERRAGIPPAPRQAQHAPDDLFDVPGSPGEAAAVDLAQERARLSRWAGGAEVSEVHVGRDGIVSSTVAGTTGLGVDGSLVGRPSRALLDLLVSVDGRRAWLLGDEAVGTTTVRTVVLAAERPRRGLEGAVVRVVTVPHEDGWVLLVAADRIYDAPTPVAMGPRRARGPIAGG